MNSLINVRLKIVCLIILTVAMNQSRAEETMTTKDLNNKRLDHSHLEDGAYVNADARVKQDMSKLGGIIKRYLFETRVDPEPTAVPLRQIDVEVLHKPSTDAVYRLGHSSMLLKLNNQIWLTDPVFSDRPSPVQWIGPKRFHPVPI
jgi:hypothetical protein